MQVKELIKILQTVDENATVSLYDLAYGERINVDTVDIDTDVRDTFEINFDSTTYLGDYI